MNALRILKSIYHPCLLLRMGAASVLSLLLLTLPARAQTAPFLTTPYYGQKGINSNFDHELPDYGADNSLVGFNGVRRGPPAAVDNCTNGINGSCYNGHDGYDFAMSYEAVIAAAAGTVVRASWAVPNTRQGVAAGFGFSVEIDHGNGYHTVYGHMSALAVKAGDPVQAGQIIGTSGATGNTGTPPGPHLHFGLYLVINTLLKPVDPFGWIGDFRNDPWYKSSTVISTCLWKDGEWASICGGVSRPIPAPVNGGEIVVDDTTDNSNGFSKGGGGGFQNVCTGDCRGWVSATAGLNSHIYHTPADRANNTPDQWAQWVPPGIPSGGAVYEVFVHTPNAYGTSWQALYLISHADGTSQAMVDQYGLSNQWVSIGTYRMNPSNSVWTHDATGEAFGSHCGANVWCELGVDAVKFVRRGTAYAPDVRNSGAWVSQVTVRNNGSGLAKTLVKFLSASGGVLCSNLPTLFANQAVTLSCNNSQVASAVVDASQDMAMVVRHAATGMVNLDNGLIPVGNGDSAFEQAGATLYGPAFYKGIFNNTNSSVYVQNIGTTNTDVTLIFKGRTGYTDYSSFAQPLAAGARLYFDAQALPTPWVGSVQIVGSNSAVPLVAKIDETSNGSGARSYNASAGGRSLIYVPAAYKNALNFNTGLVIQNLSSNTNTDVTLTYCIRNVTDPNNPAQCATQTFTNIAFQRSIGVNLSTAPVADGWSGSIKLQSTGNVPLAVAVNNAKTSADGYDFSASGYGRQTVYLPRASRSSTGPTTGYTVRNVSGATISVTALYYKTDGSLTWTRSFTLNPAATTGFFQSNDTLPDPWDGSIVLVATGNILAIMREDNTYLTNTVSGYNGVAR